MKKIFTNSVFVSAVALLCCALWGISTPIIKMGYQYMKDTNMPSVLLYAGLQFVLAGVFTVLLCSVASKKLVLPKKESVRGIVEISILQTVLQYTFSFIGLLHTTAVKATILKASEAFMAILIASLIFRQEKFTLKKIVACMIGFAGIVIVNLNGLELNINLLGDGLVLLSIFVYCLSAALLKKYSQKENPIVISGYQMLFGGLIMSFAGLLAKGSFDVAAGLWVIAILGSIFATSYCLWAVLLKYNPVSKASMHSFTTPIFGVIFSSIIIHENSNIPVINIIIALALISIGIIYWNISAKEK